MKIAALVILALLFGLGLLLGPARPLIRRGLGVSNPRHAADLPGFADGEELPRVLRYLSTLEPFAGRACFGLVLESSDGIPSRVLNLTALHPELASSFDTFLDHDGFSLAADALREWKEAADVRFAERLDPATLQSVVLSPVDNLEQGSEPSGPVGIAAGLNYADHREETKLDDIDLGFFSKFVAPSGAYAPVPIGRELDEPGHSVELMDYEVEIGFVLLESIDLSHLPADEHALLDRVAFVLANDVSDRGPIIRSPRAGYAKGKNHPGYLPLGPWMIHGSRLRLKTQSEGTVRLEMAVAVDEADPLPGGRWRQLGSSEEMIYGPLAILRKLAETWEDFTMIDRNGDPRRLVPRRDGAPVLPRGSIVLTGTMGGTAVRAPGRGDFLRLLLLGRLRMSGAFEAFRRHSVEHRREMGYLSVGDRVETRTDLLGRQLWQVVELPQEVTGP